MSDYIELPKLYFEIQPSLEKYGLTSYIEIDDRVRPTWIAQSNKERIPVTRCNIGHVLYQ